MQNFWLDRNKKIIVDWGKPITLTCRVTVEGPDFQALQRAPITSATDSELAQATAIRFSPEQVTFLKLNGSANDQVFPGDLHIES